MELQIGGWHFPNGLWAAPLQGITEDPIFRMMCRASGAELTFVPMIDIGEYCRHPDTGRTLLEHAQAEKPFAIQLLGNSKSPTKEFFDQITSFDVELVDLNLCCAARSALTTNMGGALLRKLGKAADFATSVVKYSPVPVIAKMRSGWSREFNYGSQIGKELEQSGIAAITAHGLSVKAKYSGKSNPRLIKVIREAVRIPVIANGDIKTSEDALTVLDATGAAGISIGRASIGNPYVFSELSSKSSHFFNQLNREIQPLWLLLDYVQTGKAYTIGSEFSRAKHFLYVHLKDASKKQILREQLDSIQNVGDFLTYFIPKYPVLAQHPLAKTQ